MQKYTERGAYWDEKSDPKNPGWMIWVMDENSTRHEITPCPQYYHAGQDVDGPAMIAATLEYEGWIDANNQ